MTYFDTDRRPDITSIVLTERDFKSLRRVKPEEAGKLPACLTVLKDGVLFVYRRALTESQPTSKPNGLNGSGTPKQALDRVQNEIGPVRHTPIGITFAEGQPWARRSLAAGKPMGPGRHSYRKVGR